MTVTTLSRAQQSNWADLENLQRWAVRLAIVLVAIAILGPAGPATAGEVAFFTSPAAPVVGGPLRVIAVSEEPHGPALKVISPNGKTLGRGGQGQGGSPYWSLVEVAAAEPGAYRICAGDDSACEPVLVGDRPRRPQVTKGAWPVTREWDRATENFYAAWVEKLFTDPLDAAPSWRALHEVTRQPERNLLYDHLGLGEDGENGLRLEPDCADLPYVLRAYFAWKLGLPFGYSDCSRGGGGQPPTCQRWLSALDSEDDGASLIGMQRFLDRLADVVQSGAGRAPVSDDRADFYPTRLAADTLRPGTVYADPYGHMLLLVQRVPQTAAAAGMLLAVDAQPDGTVARKRYWRGNFLFALDPTLGYAGFKHFRPIVAERGRLRPLLNAEIEASSDYGDYSLEQYGLGVEGFYDRVDAAISPQPLDPVRAFRDTIDALDEQARARLTSVTNGEEYVAKNPGVIAMPEGAAIFETIGPWEDYATPSRDLRLLIALDVVRGYPAKVEAHPQRFALPSGTSPGDVRKQLDAMLGTEATARTFDYTRSDGSKWTFTLADLLARAAALEVGYNPNDCIERRWGAPSGSAELSTCRRRAPAEQIARMDGYRSWFSERRRPPR